MMEEELSKKYESIINAIDNAEAEIESMVRQKQTETIDFSEMIKAQAKLNNAEKLIRNILDNFKKYEILNKKINLSIEVCRQCNFQKKQTQLNKKYRKE